MLSFFLRLRRRGRPEYRTYLTWNSRLPRLAGYLALILIAHVAAMAVLEDMAVFDAVWLTATTVVTVGYGDLSAKTVEGRLATMVLLYAGAIFVLAKAVNDLIDLKTEQADRKLRGAWRWDMRDHILIIGHPDRHASHFFERLVQTIRETPEIADKPVQLLTTCYGEGTLPRNLADLGVVHWNGSAITKGALEAVNAAEAHAVLVLTRAEQDPACDAETFDIVDRLSGLGPDGPTIVAECVDEANRARLARAGARATVLPMRAYPGMLIRALVAPGSEFIIEDLFTVHGDECRRIELPRPWKGDWVDVVNRVVGEGVGTPLAYQNMQNEVKINPVGATGIEARAFFVVTREGADQAPDLVRQLFA